MLLDHAGVVLLPAVLVVGLVQFQVVLGLDHLKQTKPVRDPANIATDLLHLFRHQPSGQTRQVKVECVLFPQRFRHHYAFPDIRRISAVIRSEEVLYLPIKSSIMQLQTRSASSVLQRLRTPSICSSVKPIRGPCSFTKLWTLS